MTKGNALDKLAEELAPRIGAHVAMIGDSSWTLEEYYRVRTQSDEAVSLAKYLICHLDNRHMAVTFANAVGMPGYINLR